MRICHEQLAATTFDNNSSLGVIMGTIDNAALLREMYEAWNAKDLERVASFAQTDARVLNVALGTTAGFREHEGNWAAGFPDGQIEILNLIAQGDVAICEFRGRGTHTGQLMTASGAIPPTNGKVDMTFVDVWKFSNGKIVSGKQYYDGATFAEQLGLSPASRAAREVKKGGAPVRH